MINFSLICIFLGFLCSGYAENVTYANDDETGYQVAQMGNHMLRLLLPNSCPENSERIFSAVGSEETSRCVCNHRYLQLAMSEPCYLPYRQGPCPSGHYVHSVNNETLAQCVANPCSEDGLVPYNGSCYKLAIWGEGPCEIGGLVVDSSTFQLKCLDDFTTDFHSIFTTPPIHCLAPMFLDTFSKDPKFWKCRCVEYTHLYFPSYKNCYGVYKQGPCPSGQYVHLAVNETVPKCVVNPCPEDDMVLLNGTCYEIGLWEGGPCNIGGLVIDTDTFQPKCIDESSVSFSERRQLKCSGDRILNTSDSKNASNWKCECSELGDVYFPSEDKCYGVYRQGPCPSGHYIYQAINETVPRCVPNPCLQDDLLPYNGTCQKFAIWGEGPCKVGGLVADPSTFQLKCIEEISDLSSLHKLIKCPNDFTLYGTWSEDLASWSCECPTWSHVYFPTYNACVEAYRQGPCPQGHFVYRAINETVPKCVVNPCHEDGVVPYNGYCHKLESPGDACGTDSYFSIGPPTFQIHCRTRSAAASIAAAIPMLDCSSDTQRDQNGSCRPIL